MTGNAQVRHTTASPDTADPDRTGEGAEAEPIMERPDGYYWTQPGGNVEFGPFETYELARADRDAVGDELPADGEALRQAERDIGINDWIDAETGEPAEGESPPHLEDG